MRNLTRSEIEARQRGAGRPPLGIYAICDNIRSLYNVGSIFRTADGAGVRMLYLCGMTGHPPRPEISKTALGAEMYVPWEYHPDPSVPIAILKRQGVPILVLEHTTESVPYDAPPPRPPVAIVVGHEVDGVSPAVTALADGAIEIPMRGRKESLNVAVAFGIVAYAIARAAEAGGA
ncbi:MAG: TrmH family RNA methyltransferase [Planctomycetes bacterium]|nr:TrmH family RNA methyltransferase [Planctomycetota bacterium]